MMRSHLYDALSQHYHPVCVLCHDSATPVCVFCHDAVPPECILCHSSVPLSHLSMYRATALYTTCVVHVTRLSHITHILCHDTVTPVLYSVTTLSHLCVYSVMTYSHLYVYSVVTLSHLRVYCVTTLHLYVYIYHCTMKCMFSGTDSIYRRMANQNSLPPFRSETTLLRRYDRVCASVQ